ncbi:protease [Paenibacillus sambharensis]|uniref:Protease n=1 Tax=Paenibacillus sambharensis TaxID=1803190 RepID=A0A2W1LA91_9BACL|nr:protease [Paenibacillus sambharensis]PZD95803.1 protease [Paenibacillus sambharensis]
METFFWACFAGGVLYTIVAVILGDLIGQAFDGLLDFLSLDGVDWLQPMTLVGGITVFGGAGIVLLEYSPFSQVVILGLSALTAIAASIGVYFLYVRPMKNSENSSGFSLQDLSGKLGEVWVAIPSAGYGEVVVKVGPAGVTSQIAASYDGQPIAEGSKVVVVEVKESTLYVAAVDLGE